MAQIYIGTSGYSYQDWVGPFYREGAKQKDFVTTQVFRPKAEVKQQFRNAIASYPSAYAFVPLCLCS